MNNLLSKLQRLRTTDEEYNSRSDEELLEAVSELTTKDYSLKDIKNIRDYSYHHNSLDVSLDDESDVTFSDSLEELNDETEYDNRSEYLQAYLKSKFRNLEINYYVLVHYFGLFGHEERTLSKMAVKYNKTPERIRQILKATIKSLRRNPKIKKLLCKDYVL